MKCTRYLRLLIGGFKGKNPFWAGMETRILAAFGLAVLLTGCVTVNSDKAPAAWSRLSPGMTRQEITAALGQPPVEAGSNQDFWRKGGWELHVTYDQAGLARTLLRQPVGK
jgi:hypothetical protein